MKVLLTGGNGFVAGYAATELLNNGHTPVLSDISFTKESPSECERLIADITDEGAVNELVKTVQPEACIHLGGITSVVVGSKQPALMYNVNVTGTVILLEALRTYCPAARLLFVSTAHVYGKPVNDSLLKESAPMNPSNLYAASKAAADTMTLLYSQLHDMHTMTARPNNHVGPGQSPDFVLGTFSAQIKAISRGESDPVMMTGNLKSTRDFSDVRDVARAYRLIIENGSKGSAYNIGSGHQESIGGILKMMCDIENITPEITPDPERMRPADRSPLLDTSRIQDELGWQPSISLNQTLHDILQEF